MARTGIVATVLAALAFACACGAAEPLATLPASRPATAGADWPQWRGPNRDGIAANSLKLLDTRPKEGPKLLWKSDTIPTRSLKESKNDDVGGSSCPIVSDGKVYLFVHWKHQARKFLITTQMLKDFGWEEGVPDDLAKKIEAARLSDKRKDLAGAALDAYIKQFTAAVDPELAKKFDAHIKLRLTQGREALSWEQDFAHLVKARDKEFPTFDALVSAVDDVFNPGTHGHPGSDKIMPLFVEFFLNTVFHYTDTVVCLDAATGKELWKKEFPGELPERECHWPNSGTPAIVKDRMYVAGSAGLYCLAVKDGALVWHVKAMLGHSSPLVADGRIYIYEGDPDKNRCANRSAFFGVGMLTAYSAEDGRLLWHQPKVKYTNGSVALWTHGGKNYLISGAAGGRGPRRGRVQPGRADTSERRCLPCAGGVKSLTPTAEARRRFPEGLPPPRNPRLPDRETGRQRANLVHSAKHTLSRTAMAIPACPGPGRWRRRAGRRRGRRAWAG